MYYDLKLGLGCNSGKDLSKDIRNDQLVEPYASETPNMFLLFVQFSFFVFLDWYISYEWKGNKRKTPFDNLYL